MTDSQTLPDNFQETSQIAVDFQEENNSSTHPGVLDTLNIVIECIYHSQIFNKIQKLMWWYLYHNFQETLQIFSNK